MQVSRRLIALGAASAILIAACGGSAATRLRQPRLRPAQPPRRRPPPARPRPPRPPSTTRRASRSTPAASATRASTTSPRRASTRRGAAGFQTAYSEAKGASDYAANIQRLIDEGCQTIVTVGFNQAQATVEATLANPDIAFAQVDATWDDDGQRPHPGQLHRPRLPDRRGGHARRVPGRRLQQDQDHRHVRRRAVPRRDPVHGRPLRRHQDLQPGEEHDRQAPRLGCREADRHLRRRRQPLGRCRQGRAARQDVRGPGRGHRRPGRRRTGNGSIKAMAAAGSGRSASTPTRRSPCPSTARRS